jgi:hypothetical protein
MKITTNPATALLTCNPSTQGATSVASLPISPWRADLVAPNSRPTMRHRAELATDPSNHNSIVPTGAAPANGRGVYQAAKQAAPPRGVPR